MGRKMSTEEFIEKAIKIHGGVYDYSNTIYNGAHGKVEIICSKHGLFSQISNNHLNGYGCPTCGRLDTLETFIDKAIERHGDRYNYDMVDYIDCKTKVCIACKEHGYFYQTPSSHLYGKNCPKCSGKQKLNLEEFIEKAKNIHGNKYDYSNFIYVNATTKGLITCKIHGDFLQTPNSHISGNSGCPKCANKPIHIKRNNYSDNMDLLLERFNDIHNFKYDYSKVIYKTRNSKIIIKCKEHGDFETTINSHLDGVGCKMCKEEHKKKYFLNKSNEFHGNKYDYSKIGDIKSLNDKVCIICPIHGEFFQTARSHMNGRNCIKCMYAKQVIYTDKYINKNLEKLKNTESKLYIIKCYNDDEIFYKIGITKFDVKTRFRKKIFKYNYKEIKIINDNLYNIIYLERKLHELNSEYKYLPKLIFDGYTECFSDISLVNQYLTNEF
jgi:Zn ribbon nucleic-acid-binding protein